MVDDITNCMYTKNGMIFLFVQYSNKENFKCKFIHLGQITFQYEMVVDYLP